MPEPQHYDRLLVKIASHVDDTLSRSSERLPPNDLRATLSALTTIRAFVMSERRHVAQQMHDGVRPTFLWEER
jgi:hypothetical protein